MKAYSIDPQTQSIKELDIIVEANTTYSFFNSILIDESESIAQHVIYSDAQALDAEKKPFFIGGELFVGEVLILGREDFADKEVSIPQDELELLVNYEVLPFYVDVLALLKEQDINLYRLVEITHKGEKTSYNIETLLRTFNIADERTKEYFTTELQKVISQKSNVQEYMSKMALLALQAGA